MNSLLSVANGFLQYKRGQQTGLAGLLALALVVFLAYQWEFVVPVLNFIGVIPLLDKMGLIYDDAYLTGYSIFMVAFRFTILFCVLASILIALGIVLSMLFSSKFGFVCIALPIMILFSPLLILYSVIRDLFISDEEKAERSKKYREYNKKPIDMIKETSEELTKEAALIQLNKLPTTGDQHFLLGVTNRDEVFAILPMPLPIYNEYNYESREFPVIALDIVKPYIKYEDFEKAPLKERLTISVSNQDVGRLSFNEDITFLKPSNIFNHIFREITHINAFRAYMEDTNESYFTRKENLLKRITNAQSKEDFDKYVSYVSELSASNEDIVEIMRNSKGINA